MEIRKIEAEAIKEVVEIVRELKDLELSMIGGGCGDITLGRPIR
jgi:hypothetical protein